MLPYPEKKAIIQPRRDFDDGYVLVTVIFIIAILTISAAAIATISQTESHIVRNERLYMKEFYNADSGLNVAAEKYKSWEASLGNNGENYWTSNGTSYVQDEFGVKTIIEAFRIEETYSNDFEAGHGSFPELKHVDHPLMGSGTGVTGEVLIKRYAINARQENGNVEVQAGVYKYIPNRDKNRDL